MKKTLLIFATLSIFTLTACNNQIAVPPTQDGPDIVNPGTDKPDQTAEPVSIYAFYIAAEDDGQSGQAIGCGDSIVGIYTGKDNASGDLSKQLEQAYTHILSNKDSHFGESGFSNTLGASNLKYDRSEIGEDGSVTIYLTGELSIAGVCDHPRIEGQLSQTALQFDQVKTVNVMINDKSLQSYLDLSGGDGEEQVMIETF